MSVCSNEKGIYLRSPNIDPSSENGFPSGNATSFLATVRGNCQHSPEDDGFIVPVITSAPPVTTTTIKHTERCVGVNFPPDEKVLFTKNRIEDLPEIV